MAVYKIASHSQTLFFSFPRSLSLLVSNALFFLSLHPSECNYNDDLTERECLSFSLSSDNDLPVMYVSCFPGRQRVLFLVSYSLFMLSAPPTSISHECIIPFLPLLSSLLSSPASSSLLYPQTKESTMRASILSIPQSVSICLLFILFYIIPLPATCIHSCSLTRNYTCDEGREKRDEQKVLFVL